MPVKVNTGTRTVDLSTPTPLFEVAARNLNGRWYAVSAYGRFLMNTTPASAQTQRFELVVNWPAELNKSDSGSALLRVHQRWSFVHKPPAIEVPERLCMVGDRQTNVNFSIADHSQIGCRFSGCKCYGGAWW